MLPRIRLRICGLLWLGRLACLQAFNGSFGAVQRFMAGGVSPGIPAVAVTSNGLRWPLS